MIKLEDLKIGNIIEAKFRDILYLAEIFQLTDSGLLCLVPRNFSIGISINAFEQGWEERHGLCKCKLLQHKFWILPFREVMRVVPELQW